MARTKKHPAFEQAWLFSRSHRRDQGRGAGEYVCFQPLCAVMALSPEDFPDPFLWGIA
jgi:hypothetical protein